MQQYGGVWYKTNTRQVNNIALPILRLRPNVLDAIINGNYNERYLQQLKAKITTGNSLDFSKLYIEMDRLSEAEDPVFTTLKDEYSIL